MAESRKTKSRRKPIFTDDPNVFPVDCILKRRQIGTKIEYFVKWAGYPDTENSWVDESNITPDLIKSFNLRVKRNATNQVQVVSLATQTLDVQENRSAATQDMSSDESEIEHNNQSCDSYFEEGLRNLDFNVQLQSTTDDFRLFSSPTNGKDLSTKDLQS